jgi:NADPH2:quinone reductase
VEEVGEDVKDIRPGDQVAVLWGNTYAEYSLVARKNIAKVPSGVPLETAAACFLQGLTAAYLTTDCYKVKPGDFVLLPAAAGGTGLLIAQFCKAFGATVIGTVSTEAKAAVAKAHGVDHAIVYSQQSIVDEVMRVTNGEGVQVAFDGVGQATLDSTLASLARRGKFISFGAASGHITNFPLSRLTKNAISLMRPSLADYVRTQEELDHCINNYVDYTLFDTF